MKIEIASSSVIITVTVSLNLKNGFRTLPYPPIVEELG